MGQSVHQPASNIREVALVAEGRVGGQHLSVSAGQEVTRRCQRRGLLLPAFPVPQCLPRSQRGNCGVDKHFARRTEESKKQAARSTHSQQQRGGDRTDSSAAHQDLIGRSISRHTLSSLSLSPSLSSDLACLAVVCPTPRSLPSAAVAGCSALSARRTTLQISI